MNSTAIPSAPILTQERLKWLLHYDPETGVFTNMVTRGPRVAGAVCGFVAAGRYLATKIDGREYLLHRLAVLYVTGRWPAEEVDHGDGDGFNNRWKNLRECSHAQNHQNRTVRNGARSGRAGVTYKSRIGRWEARIMVDGKRSFLGIFKSADAAAQAYIDAKAKLHTFNPMVRDGLHRSPLPRDRG